MQQRRTSQFSGLVLVADGNEWWYEATAPAPRHDPAMTRFAYRDGAADG